MVTAKMWGQRGIRRARELGIDPDRLPPGQSPTEKFPVLTIGSTPSVAPSEWSLTITGEVESPFTVSYDDLTRTLPQVEQRCDIHCVTRWSKFDTAWVGVRVRDLLARARPTERATHALVHATPDYTTNLPLEALLADDVLVAHTYDGAPLEPDHGGPARLLVPRLYFWKSAKWVSAIEILDHDVPGIWERNGYHHEGDPWREERHSVDPIESRMQRRALRRSGDEQPKF